MMTPVKLLAIDPGEKVGWAVGESLPDQLTVVQHGITPWKEFVMTLGERIQHYDEVIYETFRLFAGERGRAQTGSDLPTAQCVGVVRYLGWLHPSVHIVGQAPSPCKKTGEKVAEGDVKALIAREPKTHDDAHDIDAVRHLSYRHHKREIARLTNE